ncbi:hypothetical protein FACS189490_13350 [Clostridia bacterium]|nr:hypothetical protein FACS189490_13350 [Clostridia bacterium]
MNYLTPLEQLEQRAEDDGLHIHNFSISRTKKAACVCVKDYNAVVLDRDRIETKTEEAVLLAEEIAHYETDSLYYIEASYNTKHAHYSRVLAETRANTAKLFILVPPDRLSRVFRKYRNYDYTSRLCEVAEEFGVTSDFLEEAVTYYTETGRL